MGLTLVSGAAGFIGYHLSERLLARGEEVLGVDNLNAYYDVRLKEDRLHLLKQYPRFQFRKLDIADRTGVEALFQEFAPEKVVHLGAQAGIRYSVENPHLYVESNITGFLHILEGCRQHHIQHLVFASSSSVYGANKKTPFSVDDNVDHPVSLYAATKKSNELMAYTYSHLYGIPVTGLRFFTVYGPWGRPDMAAFLFTKAILEGRPVDVFNYGKMKRDFTYIDDIVEGIARVLDRSPQRAPDVGAAYKIYNIGNHQPVELGYFISVLEDCLGKKAIKNLLPLQPGDVLETHADVAELIRDTGFSPKTSIETGLGKFVAWYRTYYQMSKIKEKEE